jgi:hypothetical protein
MVADEAHSPRVEVGASQATTVASVTTMSAPGSFGASLRSASRARGPREERQGDGLHCPPERVSKKRGEELVPRDGHAR